MSALLASWESWLLICAADGSDRHKKGEILPQRRRSGGLKTIYKPGKNCTRVKLRTSSDLFTLFPWHLCLEADCEIRGNDNLFLQTASKPQTILYLFGEGWCVVLRNRTEQEEIIPVVVSPLPGVVRLPPQCVWYVGGAGLVFSLKTRNHSSPRYFGNFLCCQSDRSDTAPHLIFSLKIFPLCRKV